MVRPALRSRSYRKVKQTTPGGRQVVRYKRRKPKAAHCGNCGAQLSGVPKQRPIDMQRLAKTKKRPERPYGGALCPKCLKLKIKESVR